MPIELVNLLKDLLLGGTAGSRPVKKTPQDLIQEGNALEDAGLLEPALELYEAAIALAPTHAPAYLSRGNILLLQGNASAALAAYANALLHDPRYAAGHFNSGNALLRLGRKHEALAAYKAAVEMQAEFVDAWVAQGYVLEDFGELEAAAACYQRALELRPDYAEVHSNMGNVQKLLGQFDAALVSYQQALHLNPANPESHNNLGVLLAEMGRNHDAQRCYHKALDIQPDYAQAYGNLGNAQLEQACAADAELSFRQALLHDPDFAQAHNNLGNALQTLGKLDAAEQSYRAALRLKPDYFAAFSNLLFMQNYRATSCTALGDALRFGEAVRQHAHPYTHWPNSKEPQRCLRVGLVSGDFCAHPVGYFLQSIVGVLSARAQGSLSLHAYSNHTLCDAVTEQLKPCFQQWRSVVGLPDDRFAKLLREDKIDILIDLAGHTAHNRLPVFAWKAAPIQISWPGYFATTGLTAIDYFIADPWTLPDAEEKNFVEKIWRLPDTRLCFSAPAQDTAVHPLPALESGHVTFACFNNLSKMEDTVVEVWARLLAAVPDSRLFLKAKPLSATPICQHTKQRFAAQGIDPSRLILEGLSPRAEYLAAYHRVDIALDPFPYNGATTTMEALWMGVPVLTLAGKQLVARQGVGILTNAGLQDWIATDPDNYVALGAAHASNLMQLAALRQGLRGRLSSSPMLDAQRFGLHLDAALRNMWMQWCNATI